MPFSLGQTYFHLYLVVWELSHYRGNLQSIRINHVEGSASWCMITDRYQWRVIFSYCNRCWSKCTLYLLITSLLSNFFWNVFETLCPLPCSRKLNTLSRYCTKFCPHNEHTGASSMGSTSIPNTSQPESVLSQDVWNPILLLFIPHFTLSTFCLVLAY